MHILEAALASNLAASAKHRSVHHRSGDGHAPGKARWTLARLVARWRVSPGRNR